MKTPEIARNRVGAMEILGIFGFSLMLGWLFLIVLSFSSYGAHQGDDLGRNITLFALFAGVVCGYVLIRLVASRFTFKTNFIWLLVGNLLISLTIPSCVVLSHIGVRAPYGFYGVLYFLSGIATAYFIVCLLDICGKTRINNFLVFTSASFLGASLLFFLCWLVPEIAQPVMSMIFMLGSVGLLHFINSRTSKNQDIVIRKRAEFFVSPLELEPFIFVFGMIYGIACVLLLKVGSVGILAGVAGILIASAILSIVALFHTKLSIVVLMRFMVVLLVASCLVIPFTDGVLYIVSTCVPVALWAVFTACNCASLLKIVISKGLPVFYHISIGLIPKSAGFLIGWALATLFVVYGVNKADSLLIMLLVAAFLLVLVSMVFYPERQHHDEQFSTEGDFVVSPITVVENSNEDLTNLKCEAVSKLYALSPRESEILYYLARGRNAEYMCNRLTVSSHTVKSHIYNIYRKTNMHSQQKIMDLIDEYPIKLSDDT